MPDGTPRKLLDIEKFKNLGWSAKIDLKEGISSTIENFKKDLNEVNELYKNGFQEEENVEQIRITLAQAELSLLQAIKTRDNQINLLKLS